MKLKNSLFEVVSDTASAKGHDYAIRLNSDHVIYKAHFPEQPITPGVCIIQIAQELLEDMVGKALLIHTVKNVKFLRVISPVDTPDICYSLQNVSEEDGMVKAQVAVVSGDDVYAKISFICQIA